VYNN